jgi:hypothetical protein
VKFVAEDANLNMAPNLAARAADRASELQRKVIINHMLFLPAVDSRKLVIIARSTLFPLSRIAISLGATQQTTFSAPKSPDCTTT